MFRSSHIFFSAHVPIEGYQNTPPFVVSLFTAAPQIVGILTMLNGSLIYPGLTSIYVTFKAALFLKYIQLFKLAAPSHEFMKNTV
jgi:hypothetical protein